MLLFESKRESLSRVLRAAPKTGEKKSRKAEHQKRRDHFFSQVFPPSALLQISLLLVESTISAGPWTSPRTSM